MNVSANQIIWSADVDIDDLRTAVSEKALPEGTIIKLDRLFFEQYNKEWINFCQGAGYPVFADAKIIEIPDKCLAIAETYLKHQPFMLNIMAGACSTGRMEDENPKKVDCLKRFAEACAAAETKSCAVTVLTSKDSILASEEFGIDVDVQVEWYVDLMHDAGLTDIVCSPQEAKDLRYDTDFKDMSINTPGVRLPDTDVRDQARITTPAEALKNGADRLVIGSNLTDGEGGIVERLKRNYDRLMEHFASVE